VKRKPILTMFLGVAALVMTSCGTSDSIKSVLLTSTGANNSGFYNLAGADSTLQLQVLAIYNSGKQIDVTNAVSTWTVTVVGADNTNTALPPYGPTTVPINTTGLMTDIYPLCTWVDLPLSAPATPPNWAYTGYYQVTATYRQFTSQPIAVGVGSLTSNAPTGGCGPS
jgi:hypothetical protein